MKPIIDLLIVLSFILISVLAITDNTIEQIEHDLGITNSKEIK
jgi:hypothetical protein